MPPPPEPTTGLAIDLARISTVLCDADGNLFPSEEPAFEASVTVTNALLAELGSPVRYTADELRRQALGRNFRSLAIDLASDLGVELTPDQLEGWVAEEARVVTEHLVEVLVPDPVARGALERIARRLDLAVVSSSALPRLAGCFTAVGLDDLFPPDLRFSAQDSLPTPTSKPDPAVYVHALAVLGLQPDQAVAVEDAVSGVASAVAAGIPTLGNLVHVAGRDRPERARQLREAGAAAVVMDWDHLAHLLTEPEEAAS